MNEKNEKPCYGHSVTVEQMKINLVQAISGIVAFGTVLILFKGGDYKWLSIAVFAVTVFIFGYFFKKNEKGSG